MAAATAAASVSDRHAAFTAGFEAGACAIEKLPRLVNVDSIFASMAFHRGFNASGRGLEEDESVLAWLLFTNDHGKPVQMASMYQFMTRKLCAFGNPAEVPIPMADLTIAKQPTLVWLLRHLRQFRPVVWAALVQFVKTGSGIPRWCDAAHMQAFGALMLDAFEPIIARGHFDASQLERHMADTHRVPADVANLVGQFVTSGIIPLRRRDHSHPRSEASLECTPKSGSGAVVVHTA